MPHFSRLTDIITCSLTEIIDNADSPIETLREVIGEMTEGLAACRRTVRTSSANWKRLQSEIEQYQQQINAWMEKAREALAAGDEDAARSSVTRKQELDHLIQGLEPERRAAHETWQNMLRIQRALEARHAEAVRRLSELTGEPATVPLESETAVHDAQAAEADRADEVEAELAALRRQLGQ